MNRIIADNMIVFISGVPGAGKTTISYTLLKNLEIFRIVQETDILREILRGYNECLIKNTPIDKSELINILPHTDLLSYSRAKEQCEAMKYSIEEIVKRQNRKSIPTIICGVHIIPEILYKTMSGSNIKYVNLYFDCEEDLYSHLKERDENKYGKKSVPFLFKMNSELQDSILALQSENPKCFTSVNVGKCSIEETANIIINFLYQ
ncbi:MAG: hypothetical protein J6C00_03235 [Eubacterium sp.]|nr:hypothetical protein [Eubacterium sp.]